jgi:hypothetical protein
MALLNMIEFKTKLMLSYGLLLTNDCNITLLNLVKELSEILKEIKPSS